MAIAVKVDSEDLPGLASILGLGGMPRQAADAPDPNEPPPIDPSMGGAGDPTAQPASSAQSDNQTLPDPANGAPVKNKLQSLREFLSPGGPPDPAVPVPPLQVPGQGQQMPPADLAQSMAAGTAHINPTFREAHPVVSTLAKIALAAGQGGLTGSQYANAGQGFEAARNAPIEMAAKKQALQKGTLENMLLGGQVQYLPQKYGLEAAKTKSDIDKNSAEATKNNAEAAAIPTKTALEKVQTEAANYKDDPNLGLIDLRTGKPIAGDQASAPLTAAEAAVLGKQPGDRVPLKLKNTASEIATRGITTVNTEQGVFERNRQTGSMTRLGDNPRMMFAPDQKIIQVADPDNPGQTKFVKAGDAVAQGLAGTASASVSVPKNVLKWATTGDGAKQAGAFNTAMAHADLLEKAVTALGNGDTRTLNSIKNSFKKEFGSADVSNFNVISNAYSREITKMLSAGHMTDSEIGSAEATLPSDASPDQLLGAIHAYKALAGSKMVILHDQFTKGMKGQPNFPDQTQGSNPPATGTSASTPANLPGHAQARDKKLGVVY